MDSESKATATRISGSATAKAIRGEIKEAVDQLREAHGKVPGLGVVLVGERKDSQTYVRMKKKACEECGIKSFGVDLPATATEEEVINAVAAMNDNPEIHGVLVQLPLPSHVNENRVLDCISVEKDVDGLHPMNVGLMALKGRAPRFIPCTPKGCMELLRRYNVEIEGKKAVVIGRSNIVGFPMSVLLQQANATVTVCHSRTRNMEEEIKAADIVVAALGKAQFLKGESLKPGAVVIDVGINPIPDDTKKSGQRLVGDVDYASAKEVASAITPVPGGVGPMTIAMLLSNTYEAAKRDFEQAQE